jgi:uncharacterized protein DUF6766
VRFLRVNSLALVLAVLFLISVGGQSYAGWKTYDSDQRAHHSAVIGYPRYLVSSDFYDNVMSNWQSEFLQISLYVMFAVWFRQKGSAESRDPDEPVTDSDEEEMLGRHLKKNSPRWARAGGWRLRIYQNSLLISMGVLFFLSWFAMAVAQHNVYNQNQLDHHQAAVSLTGFFGSSYFWNETFQNWQSEFLAVGVFAVATIYLRQRGSTESKPVGAPHDETGS